MICVATAGRAGYCSTECREDAGCPAGFACREIQPIGEFAGQKFCAWKQCSAVADCGNKKDFCCRQMPGGEVLNLSYCDFSSNGPCE